MPNLAQFNQKLLNGGARRIGAVWITDEIIFNDFWLQNQYFITSKTNFWNMPQTNLLTYSNPKNDWGGVLDRFYKNRVITMEWTIIASDADDLENKIDALKKALSVKTGYLQMKIWSKYRRILCTLTNQDIIDRSHYDITRGKYKLTFTALDPFRSEKEWTSILYSWINADINEDIINEGSEYSNPIINILVNSASGVSELKNKIGENELVVNQPLQAGDIFEINAITKTVSINGVSVDFSWRFPNFESGLNTYSMDCNGTFNFDIAVLFPKNYL